MVTAIWLLKDGKMRYLRCLRITSTEPDEYCMCYEYTISHFVTLISICLSTNRQPSQPQFVPATTVQQGYGCKPHS